jgi:hypothetical protein
LLLNDELRYELEDLLLETFLSWRKLSKLELYDLCIALGLNPPVRSPISNLLQALVTDFQAKHCLIAPHRKIILYMQVLRCSLPELQNLCVANKIAFCKHDDGSVLLQDKVVNFMAKDGLVIRELAGYDQLEAFKRVRS